MNRNQRLAQVRWVKSSYSGPEGGNCLEWAPSKIASGTVPVRDSKAPEVGVLVLSPSAWSSFVSYAQDQTV
ncbi:DUF397 domain-containing protein [Streptomyces sp. NPDC001508]|uniref:DUF397 domain-containing protein n=1 Tax=Streptomyces sp. NPDC001508 TaxID=3154656 RepID=UPI00332A9CBD